MNADGPDGIAAQECRGDFWNKLEEAMDQAGGGMPVESLAEMRFADVVDGTDEARPT